MLDPLTIVLGVLSLGAKVALVEVTSQQLWPWSAELCLFTFTYIAASSKDACFQQ